jgi:hypothetical protein
MATVVKFQPRNAAAFCGEAEARAYYRLCRFLFDLALADGDVREAMAQVEDVLGYPLPAFADARLRKERDDLAVVMVGLAHHRFVEAERAKAMGE